MPALIVLQASFLLPPFGYALMMTRAVARQKRPAAAMACALRPFLLLQLALLATVLLLPRLVHPGRASAPSEAATDAETRERLENSFYASPQAA